MKMYNRMIKITFAAFLLTVIACKEKNVSAQQSNSLSQSKPQMDINTAAATGNFEAVKQHLAAGTDINEKDPFGGSSPLISASLFGKTDVAKVLIDAGANINFQ